MFTAAVKKKKNTFPVFSLVKEKRPHLCMVVKGYSGVEGACLVSWGRSRGEGKG